MQSPCYCIVMEYCPYGQLYEVLRDGKDIPPTLLVSWTKQIATGMSYLHTHKIIHRDLKSPKLVDCSVCRYLPVSDCLSSKVRENARKRSRNMSPITSIVLLENSRF